MSDNKFKKIKKCMKTEVNQFSRTWTRTWVPLLLNDVLLNVLVCAQLSSKLAHGTYSLCFITQLFIFWDTLLFSIFIPNCALRALIFIGPTCTWYIFLVTTAKRKALRKHSLHEENSSLEFIELFINGNERCYTTDAPSAWADIYFQM